MNWEIQSQGKINLNFERDGESKAITNDRVSCN